MSHIYSSRICCCILVLVVLIAGFVVSPVVADQDSNQLETEWLDGEVVVKAVYINEEFDHEQKLVQREKREEYYSTTLRLRVNHDRMKYLSENPEKIADYDVTTMTQVVTGSNTVYDEAKDILAGPSQRFSVKYTTQCDSWRRNGEDRLVHCYQSKGSANLNYGDISAGIGFVPSAGRYTYRINIRAGSGLAPFMNAGAPKVQAKYWDELEEKWVTDEVKYGMQLPNITPLEITNFEYNQSPEETVQFANISDTFSLEDFLKNPDTARTFPINAGWNSKTSTSHSSLSVTGTLILRGERKPVEAVIIPQKGFEEWTPAAGADEATPGKSLAVEVKLHIKDKPEVEPRQTAKFKVILEGTSTEKGICVNYPVQGGKNEFDLKLNGQSNPELTVAEDGQSAESKDGLKQIVIYLNSHDWAAYSRLRVIATLDDGQVVEAYVEGDKEQKQLVIPKDDNRNYIADAWEKQLGIYQKNYEPGWDDDAIPAKQRRNGDGYTLYEEYRGFMTTKGVKRTSPLKKDLFVYDPDGLVKTYYEPYNPAGLELHYVDPTMMKFNGVAKSPENRWVNCNSEKHRYARQYAMFVKQWTTMGATAGEAYWFTLTDLLNEVDPYQGFIQPLKECYVIKIAPTVIERSLKGIDPRVRQQAYRLLMTSTVIHEIGHGLGIRHHAEGGAETEDSLVTGVFDCAMRYNTPGEYGHPELLKPQTRYCAKGEKWKKPDETKDKKGNTQYVFDEIASHNCFGQIDVKTDP